MFPVSIAKGHSPLELKYDSPIQPYQASREGRESGESEGDMVREVDKGCTK
jgi:hypothetical protein